MKNIDLTIFIYIDYIENYRIILNLIISSSRLFIKYETRFKKLIFVLTYFYITIFVENVKLLFNNYIFKFIIKYLVMLFIIVINILSYVILIKNGFKYSILLFRKL